GKAFEPSSDPLLSKLRPYVADIKFGDTDIHDKVAPILSDASIFGSDLYKVGLGERVEAYFKELIAGPGAIISTLKKYV
ncbi:MAG: mannitol dehydrogenase family protein, partial [Lachnospiraceae bacterium]|nr:mannitol dehydrogenase family protein [Lachnospiraceae bacterium]